MHKISVIRFSNSRKGVWIRFCKSFTNLLQTFTKAKGCGRILQESGIKIFLERWILGGEKLVDNRVGEEDLHKRKKFRCISKYVILYSQAYFEKKK